MVAKLYAYVGVMIKRMMRFNGERQNAEEEQSEEIIRQLQQQQQAGADAASTAEESNQDAEASNEGLITRIGREIDKFSKVVR